MLPKGPYQPQLTESEILKFWLENKFYSPEYKSEKKLSTAKEKNRKAFTIVLPPPNANGNLHLGHMSGYAYQDLMGRLARMQGKKVLLLPGKDHAGIQTEVVFERELEKQGKSKKELGREKFYQLCYDFCTKKAENARNQEKKIGLSADFDRELFTLDPKIVAEVTKAFELMYKDGLIYRDKRIINWCTRCQSALADIDTEFKDSVSPFYYFKYGFLEPEQDAVKIKNDFAKLKEVEWIFERATTIDGKEKYPFALGRIKSGYNIKTGEMYVHCLGYKHEKFKKGDVLKGEPYAIMMRLNNKFSLILTNPDFKGDLDQELQKLRKIAESKKRDAGIHFIKFDEYPEDKFYTNGFVLGTVRPETKFGDTALAVDPDDERYKEYIGKEFEVRTLTGTAKIKVIADNAVDEDFGTGMVKVTPAHSMEDWNIAQRHKKEAMPEKQVINFDGKLNHLTGKYEGMTVKEARKAMIPDMKEAGMLVYLDENYQNRIRICERCKYPIEPLISYQWFVDTKPLKTEAKRLVEQGFTKILPEGKKKTYMQWMDTEEDWCITRQLWWGYRLPVWYKGKREQYITQTGEVKEKIADKVIEKAEDYEGLLQVRSDNPNINSTDEWQQDTDVLDTWFSSGQWPFVTLMAKAGDYENFYPTHVMETGWDILLFWVTRMMLLNPYRARLYQNSDGQTQNTNSDTSGLRIQDEKIVPFKDVYLHGLVLDKNGIKMSKSKGNGIDPFEMMQKYGTDALRFSFIKGNSVGQNYRLYEEKIASNRNFCNKIWNASKFILLNIDDNTDKLINLTQQELSLTDNDKTFLKHIDELIIETTRRLSDFQFGIAGDELFDSFWHRFADIYLEQIKNRLYTKDRDGNPINSTPSEKESRLTAQWILLYSLEVYLKLLHPFIPFITENIWQALPKHDNESETIMYSKWPEVSKDKNSR